MYECESWTIKKAKHWRIDAFELWCWKRLLRVPWTVKEIKPVNPKGDQRWIFIGRTDAEAKAPIFWLPDAKNWLIGKTLMLGRIDGRRRRGWQRMIWLDGVTNLMWIWASSGNWWWTGKSGVLQFMGLQRVRHDWSNLAAAAAIRYKIGNFSSIVQSYPTLCNPMNHSTPGLFVQNQLPDFTQAHVHWVNDAI